MIKKHLNTDLIWRAIGAAGLAFGDTLPAIKVIVYKNAVTGSNFTLTSTFFVYITAAVLLMTPQVVGLLLSKIKR